MTDVGHDSKPNSTRSLATPRFLDALAHSVQLHGADTRKTGRAPAIAHLLGVCSLVLYDGRSEDEAIAALLHDSLEDHPNEVNRKELKRRYGANVLGLIEACTDTPADYNNGPKPPWRERKQAYLETLRSAGESALRLAVADKLDNARSLIADDCQINKKDLWERFHAGKEDQLWFFHARQGVSREAKMSGPLWEEFDRVVAELERIC